MKKSVALLAILLIVPVAACGSSGDESGGASPNVPSGAGGEPASSAALAGQTFVATEAKGVEITDRVPLTIAFEEDRMSVDAGCNRIGGNYFPSLIPGLSAVPAAHRKDYIWSSVGPATFVL